jgi:hypothetical protein
MFRILKTMNLFRTFVPAAAVACALVAAGEGTARADDAAARGEAERALAEAGPKVAPSAPRIEVAILLDTSGSMDGLIDQARTRIWAIVNSLAKAKRGGVAPDLRVALYEYGQTPVGPASGYIRRVQPLTDDLDALSASLFALRTNGGDEYCGMAIATAVRDLEWTAGEHFRAVFIAGNEPFTQGNVFYAEACAAARAKGIVVNTIHCGPESAARDGQWTEGAKLGGGQCINIDQDAASAEAETPFDERLRGLSESLNRTYVGYGREGRERAEAQKAQDSAAHAAAPSAAAERAVTKGGHGYRNSSWDIVDAVAEGRIDLEKAAAEDLPEEMRKMSGEERRAYVAKKSEERKAIQAEIGKLAAEREAFLAEARKKRADAGKDTFDSAVREILERQLEARGFSAEGATR